MSAEVTMRNLARGNAIRLDGARWRRKVGALPFPEGHRALADALEDDPPEGVRLTRFLRAAHRIGERRVHRILEAAGIQRKNPYRKVRELTTGERQRLAAELRRVADAAELS